MALPGVWPARQRSPALQTACLGLCRCLVLTVQSPAQQRHSRNRPTPMSQHQALALYPQSTRSVTMATGGPRVGTEVTAAAASFPAVLLSSENPHTIKLL